VLVQVPHHPLSSRPVSTLIKTLRLPFSGLPLVGGGGGECVKTKILYIHA
jgi:hypothetical protein